LKAFLKEKFKPIKAILALENHEKTLGKVEGTVLLE